MNKYECSQNQEKYEYLNYIKIPKSSLGYKTNNIYPDYPPLMSDGRAIIATDQSETIINNSLLKDSGVKTNWEYRKYLMENSEKIREINTLEAFNDVGYYKRFVNYDNPSDSTPPPSQINNVKTQKENYQNINKKDDLINMYKTREELNSLIHSPSIIL
jgi:hypothetical protein